MKKSFVFIAIFGLFIGFPQAFAQNSSQPEADTPVSTQESSDLTGWLDKDWIFTVGEDLATGGFLGSFLGWLDGMNKGKTNQVYLGVGAMIAFLSLWVAVKGFEINPAWVASSNNEIEKFSALELKPIIAMNANKGNDFGLSLKYSF